MIENLSISYDDIDKLNDSTFIKKLHSRIDLIIENIINEFITYVAIELNKKNKIELRDEIIKRIPDLFNSFADDFKQSISMLNHISDIEQKTNLLTAILFYEKIENQIINELYRVISILKNNILSI